MYYLEAAINTLEAETVARASGEAAASASRGRADGCIDSRESLTGRARASLSARSSTPRALAAVAALLSSLHILGDRPQRTTARHSARLHITLTYSAHLYSHWTRLCTLINYKCNWNRLVKFLQWTFLLRFIFIENFTTIYSLLQKKKIIWSRTFVEVFFFIIAFDRQLPDCVGAGSSGHCGNVGIYSSVIFRS